MPKVSAVRHPATDDARPTSVSRTRLAPLAQSLVALQRAAGNEAVRALVHEGLVVQRFQHLMPFKTFKSEKHARASTTTFGFKRSTSDVKDIYKDYTAHLHRRQFAQAQQDLLALDVKIGHMRAKGYWNSDNDRDTLLNNLQNSAAQERLWLTHEAAAAVGGRQDLGQNIGNAVTPLQNRPTAVLTMGQGLVADLGQIVLYSDDFSTCSPVVLFNQNTRKGSLFHFPAQGLGTMRGHLTNAYNQVSPTHVMLNDRTLNVGFNVAMSNDVPSLTAFFQNEIGFNGQLSTIPARSDSYSVTLGANGLPDVQTGRGGAHLDATHDRTGVERQQVEQAWANAPATSKYGRDNWSRD